ncbi:MAG: hypothetical protein AB7U95_25120 [Reyranella sp.]
MNSTASTYGRVDKTTGRLTIPVPEGAKRVRLSVTGQWSDGPPGDPTPARLVVRVLGGPPHRGDPESRAEAMRHVIDGDTAFALPEKASGVTVDVAHRTPAMSLLVRLVAIPE